MSKQFESSSATGVNLQLNIAGPGARSYAFVVDWHIRLLLALAWFVAMSFVVVGSLRVLDSESPLYSDYLLLVLLPPPMIYFLYHPILEIVMRGSTPGKRIAGVRIRSQNGQLAGIPAHLIRNVLRILDSLPIGYAVGLAATIITDKSVRIGDIAAGTVLVYESDDGGNKGLSPEINPGAVTRYGLRQAELGQALLDRWDNLDEGKRIGLARKLILQLEPASTLASDDGALRTQLLQLLKGAPGA